MDYRKEVIGTNNCSNEKEELLHNISEMLGTLPTSEIIRIYSYLSALYF